MKATCVQTCGAPIVIPKPSVALPLLICLGGCLGGRGSSSVVVSYLSVFASAAVWLLQGS